MQSAAALSFTAHNVRLDDGQLTYPAAGRTIDETGNYLAVKNLLPLLFPEGWRGRSIVDLGCLEGGFATEFARLGLDSTGIEVRQSNLVNAEFLRERLALPNLKFICDDAWNLGRYGPFDIVFCAGLHYHIEDQRRFLAEMGAACGRALVMDTHVAPEADDHPAIVLHRLSPLTEHEGLPGRWYAEHELNAETDRSDLEQLKWASWENRRSFWPTRRALVQSMRDAGFPVVLEDFDQLRDLAPELLAPTGWRYRNARTMFVGLKTAGAAATRVRAPDPQGRRLGHLLGRGALRGRTLLIGAERLPQPPADGHELVSADHLADAEGRFSDILAAGVVERTADLAGLFSEFAAKLAPGGQLGLLVVDSLAPGGEGPCTPGGFLDLAQSLAERGQFPFRFEGFHATEAGEQDFIFRLGAADPADGADILATIAAVRPLLQAAGAWRPAAAPAPEPMAKPGGVAQATLALARTAEALSRTQAELDATRATLDAMLASTSWRITAPLRALRALLGPARKRTHVD
jgi:SAM-dependent methyltransferase